MKFKKAFDSVPHRALLCVHVMCKDHQHYWSSVLCQPFRHNHNNIIIIMGAGHNLTKIYKLTTKCKLGDSVGLEILEWDLGLSMQFIISFYASQIACFCWPS